MLQHPPHATHLMQPLDVVVFEPHKHYHSEAVAFELTPAVLSSLIPSKQVPNACSFYAAMLVLLSSEQLALDQAHPSPLLK